MDVKENTCHSCQIILVFCSNFLNCTGSRYKDMSNKGDVKKSGIYTKQGDMGESSLLNGERQLKNSSIFEVVGTFDELNSAIGVSYENLKALHLQNSDSITVILELLETIMHTLFDIGAFVAAPPNSSDSLLKQVMVFDLEDPKNMQISILENRIDFLDSKLPPLKNFILPIGSIAAANVHLARTICRRAERLFVAYFSNIANEFQLSDKYRQIIIKYQQIIIIKYQQII